MIRKNTPLNLPASKQYLDAPASRFYPRIARYVLASDLLAETLHRLRIDGGGSRESVLYWAGRAAGEVATIDTIIVPTGDDVIRAPRYVIVQEPAMLRITELLDPPQLVVLGQVHTHGRFTEHSDLDDERGFRNPGLISVIIERYGYDNRLWHRAWGWHESEGAGRFRRLSPKEVRSRFAVGAIPCTIQEA